MELRYLGHSAFSLKADGHEVVIDPFLTGNELTPVRPGELKPEAILLTHGHGDHVGDTLSIAQATGALVVAPVELAAWCQQRGAKVHPMNIGGARDFAFGRVKMTPAWHSSAAEGEGRLEYTGNPSGLIVEMGGTRVYHAGDTALFGDMKLIGERERPDVALLPIGDNFTMGPEDAAYAARLIGARVVVPMHYNTFDLIKQDPVAFARRVEEAGLSCKVLAPGEVLQV